MPSESAGRSVADFEGLVWVIVPEAIYDRSLWDDCAQEARIRVWELLQRDPHTPRGYISRAIKRRATEVATRDRFTGSASRRGIPSDPMRQRRDSLDALRAVGREPTAPAEVPDSDARVSAVRCAIDSLTDRQRDYVRARYYEGVPTRELQSQSREWYRPGGIRDQLRSQLAPLLGPQ